MSRFEARNSGIDCIHDLIDMALSNTPGNAVQDTLYLAVSSVNVCLSSCEEISSVFLFESHVFVKGFLSSLLIFL